MAPPTSLVPGGSSRLPKVQYDLNHLSFCQHTIYSGFFIDLRSTIYCIPIQYVTAFDMLHLMREWIILHVSSYSSSHGNKFFEKVSRHD